MKAIGFKQSLPITDKNSFRTFEIEKPSPTGRDLLVKVVANSVNPVDFKIRQNAAKDEMLDTPKIIGWDAGADDYFVKPFNPTDIIRKVEEFLD